MQAFPGPHVKHPSTRHLGRGHPSNREFISIALSSDADLSVTEFKYRYSAGSTAQVLWGVGIRNPEQLTALTDRLNAAGMVSHDISGLEVAQVCGRQDHDQRVDVIPRDMFRVTGCSMSSFDAVAAMNKTHTLACFPCCSVLRSSKLRLSFGRRCTYATWLVAVRGPTPGALRTRRSTR